MLKKKFCLMLLLLSGLMGVAIKFEHTIGLLLLSNELFYKLKGEEGGIRRSALARALVELRIEARVFMFI